MLVKSDIEDYIDVIDGELFWNDKIKGKRVGKPVLNKHKVVSFKGITYRFEDFRSLALGEAPQIYPNSEPTPEGYSVWNAMQKRCKDRGYSMSDLFSDYKTWIEWAKVQKGYKEVDIFNRPFNLDSDMFSFDVKTYSEDTCVFIPEHLNQIYKTSYKSVENIGVDTFEGGYRARLNMFNKQIIVGKFGTLGEANSAYLKKRAEYLSLLLYMNKGKLSEKVIKVVEEDINFAKSL